MSEVHKNSLPTSGQFLGVVAEALALSDGPLSGKTADRFFDGGWVKEQGRTEIFIALAQALIDKGMVPIPSIFEKYDTSMPILSLPPCREWHRIGIDFARFFRVI